MKYVSIYEKDSDILEAISVIYLNGEPFDVDPTYSKGNIYGTAFDPMRKYDLNPLDKNTKKADCRNLPLESNSVHNIVFDPPFLFRNRKSVNNNKMCKRFSFFKTFEELLEMYSNSLKEFSRILCNKGILVFKCQDMTDGKFYDTHVKIITMAQLHKFELKDIFILKGRRIIRNAKKQNCARKIHSYYLVFKYTA